MHVCLRFVVRMYQAQLVFLMFERDSQSQFTLYSSVSVLNKLISLDLNLTRVTRPYHVVTDGNIIISKLRTLNVVPIEMVALGHHHSAFVHR